MVNPWSVLGTVLNVFHLLLSMFLVVGGFLLHVDYMPLIIMSNIILLFRYHDYCFVSEITGYVKTRANGCDPGFNYTEESLKRYQDMDIDIDSHAISALSTLLFGLSTQVALLRMAIKYKVPMFKRLPAKIFAIAYLTIWLLSELYLAFYYEPLPMCPENREEKEERKLRAKRIKRERKTKKINRKLDRLKSQLIALEESDSEDELEEPGWLGVPGDVGNDQGTGGAVHRPMAENV